MQALGILAGSGEDKEKSGYLIIAIKPDLMLPLAEYRHELQLSLQRIKATPLQPGVCEIRIPSERSYRERLKNTHSGITVDRDVVLALEKLGA